ncbi:hypothetical protein AB205_0066240 [Aquarana catesbeiana]|uniref:Uncharacterized protein n=1 Tax=Aquarana catesbeiana TaxID=8400 RepID=A0A2G9RBN0_AQUCT|nr:hypothetical protein AB205_0066240 [Aquarana catesbeiana]
MLKKINSCGTNWLTLMVTLIDGMEIPPKNLLPNLTPRMYLKITMKHLMFFLLPSPLAHLLHIVSFHKTEFPKKERVNYPPPLRTLSNALLEPRILLSP